MTMTDLVETQQDTATRARSAARQVVATLTALPVATLQSMDHLASQITAKLLAGEDLPNDLADRIAAQHIAVQVDQELRAVLRTVISQLNAAAAADEATQAPAQLVALNAELRGIQDRVSRLLPVLGSVRSADAAMRADEDVLQAWRALVEISTRYSTIRQRQVELSTKHQGGTRVQIDARVVAQFGLMCDVDELWPSRADITIGRTGWPAPWPHRGEDPWAIAHDIDFLIWAAQAGAQLWVPTPVQLEKAWDDALKVAQARRTEIEPKAPERTVGLRRIAS